MANKFIIKILIVFLVFSYGCTNNQKKVPLSKQLSIAQKIANAAGFENWDNINTISFTFNVKVGDKKFHRSLTWETKNDILKFYSPETKDTISIDHKMVNQESSKDIINKDKQFINDSYWLLFPFHLIWDDDVSIAIKDSSSQLPIGEGKAMRVVVKYKDDKGYTPNDRYDLYVDNNYKILAWSFYANNSPTPSRITKWEDYKNIGGLNLSLNRPGKDENFRIWFTNVEVK